MESAHSARRLTTVMRGSVAGDPSHDSTCISDRHAFTHRVRNHVVTLGLARGSVISRDRPTVFVGHCDAFGRRGGRVQLLVSTSVPCRSALAGSVLRACAAGIKSR